MAGRHLSDSLGWFADHSEGAPVALRERAAAFLRQVEDEPDPSRRLARAAMDALAAALERPSNRAAALDLLAADALLTLALLRHAETQPADLAAFAADLRAAGVAVR
jgi:hypothetical protein